MTDGRTSRLTPLAPIPPRGRGRIPGAQYIERPPPAAKATNGDARGWTRELIRQVAMDIGISAVFHLETMYPAAIAACPPNMKLSLRNHVHNEIMAALDTTDAEAIIERLRRRKAHRRTIRKTRAKP